ncbi:MAG: FAD-dependent oxidoreductase [Candidatus Odinarchaeota archaeon]
MTEKEEFDAIVVGAGPSGCSTAIRLVQQNPSLNVALIDRGKPVGSKNTSGGILWGQSLSEIIPGWWKAAPIERRIVQKRTGFLTRKDAFVLELSFPEWAEDPPNAVSILFAKFVNWLANEAEKLGVNVFEGITVEDLSKDSAGKFNGIIQAGEEFQTDAVVIAEGANSRLTLSSGLRKEMKKKYYALGVKDVLHLPEEVINERFNLDSNTGVASEYVVSNPAFSEGLRSGGFLYTNQDTLSVGVVPQIDTMNDPDYPPYRILEAFEKHPYIHKLVEGSKLVEYSARWIPEGGIHMLPKLYDDRVLVVGDAAGFTFSNGIVLQGINYAISSGIMAADTIVHAHERNDFSRKSMSLYEKKLKQSYVLKDLKKFRNIHKILRNTRIFEQYPELITGLFKDMLTETGEPKDKILKLFRMQRKRSKIGWFQLLRDGMSFRHF